MEKPIGDYSLRLGGSTKLDDLIEAKLRREYTKAVRRINKRKWRVPEILSQLDRLRGKDRKKLEDELTLLMRKAKLDNELKELRDEIIGMLEKIITLLSKIKEWSK